MNLNLPTLLVCAVMAGAALAQPAGPTGPGEPQLPNAKPSSPQLGILGVVIGQTLTLPTCSNPGETTDAFSPTPAATRGSAVDCRMTGSAGTLLRSSNSAHATHSNLRQDFKVEIKDGKVVGITVLTAGEKGPETTLKFLKDTFGEPTSQRPASGAASDFRPAAVEWRLADGVVSFSGEAPDYPVAIVEIESTAWYDRPAPSPDPSLTSNLSSKKDKPEPKPSAKSHMVVSRSSGVSVHRLRSIIDADDAFLEKIAENDRQQFRELRDYYTSVARGAEFLMSPLGQRVWGIPAK